MLDHAHARQSLDQRALDSLTTWCAATTGGQCRVISDQARFHGRTQVLRMDTRIGICYVKIHRDRAAWENEAHGYGRWAPAFGSQAPRLLGARETPPYALLLSELPGRPMAEVSLSADQELAVWRQAGQALRRLHDRPAGSHFGPSRRNGSPLDRPINNAIIYIGQELAEGRQKGVAAGWLNETELAVTGAALERLVAFREELPVPCHRDYGPANWLIAPDGTWAGVIDFEFSRWGVRVADFSRYPDWEWIRRPELIDALMAGYGRALTSQEQEQRLVARVRYALSAIVWGQANAYYGFVQEGRDALRHLASTLL
jgi:Ser/Thr protein kinase RdoA (MazF antagonist)